MTALRTLLNHTKLLASPFQFRNTQLSCKLQPAVLGYARHSLFESTFVHLFIAKIIHHLYLSISSLLQQTREMSRVKRRFTHPPYWHPLKNVNVLKHHYTVYYSLLKTFQSCREMMKTSFPKIKALFRKPSKTSTVKFPRSMLKSWRTARGTREQ